MACITLDNERCTIADALLDIYGETFDLLFIDIVKVDTLKRMWPVLETQCMEHCLVPTFLMSSYDEETCNYVQALVASLKHVELSHLSIVADTCGAKRVFLARAIARSCVGRLRTLLSIAWECAHRTLSRWQCRCIWSNSGWTYGYVRGCVTLSRYRSKQCTGGLLGGGSFFDKNALVRLQRNRRGGWRVFLTGEASVIGCCHCHYFG